ncbi:MAG: hypothetical protein ABSF71_21625 [Terriglobia bacterium]
MADGLRYPAAVVDRVRDLAHSLLDVQIAEQFNREGHPSATSTPYAAKMIQWIRRGHRIPPAALQKPEELTVQQAAKHFEVSDGSVYYWIERRLLQARRLHGGRPCWITLSASEDGNCGTGYANQAESKMAKYPKPLPAEV